MKYTLFALFAVVFFSIHLSAQLNDQEKGAFVRLRDIDPKVSSYSYDMMMKTLMRHGSDLKDCAQPLMKYFALKSFHELIDNPSRATYQVYLNEMETFSGVHDIAPYKDELMSGNVYTYVDYMVASSCDEDYQKLGIKLRNESLSEYESLFDKYRRSKIMLITVKLI